MFSLTERRKFEDLESSVAEAAEHNIITDDVKKAEGGRHRTTFQWCRHGVAMVLLWCCHLPSETRMSAVLDQGSSDHLFQAAQCPGVVATMKDALGKLEVANTSGDLAALQDDMLSGSPEIETTGTIDSGQK